MATSFTDITSTFDSLHSMRGFIEFIIKDRRGNVVERRQENLIKIFMKEVLAHRLPFSKVWNPVGGTGTGAWEDGTWDPAEEFAAKYIMFGASFDENGVPLDDNDPRFYTLDSTTQTMVPIRLGVGAEYDGGLINAVPLADPNRPLKKIEAVSFEPTAQPAGTPLLQDDVRSMNNIVSMSTTLRLEEYNGFGLTNSDYFTITEVALVAGKTFNETPCCECDPKDVFLEGNPDGSPLMVTANGTDVVTLDATEPVDVIKKGDQVKLVELGTGSGSGTDGLNQVTPFYLVIDKLPGGRDIQLDRVPSDADQKPIMGDIGIYRTTMRIIAHRVLNTPLKKSQDYEIIVKWNVIFA